MAEETALQSTVADDVGVSNNGEMATTPVDTTTTTPVDTTTTDVVPELATDDITTGIEENVDFSGDYINKDTSTVAGQLESLLASDSSYIKEAQKSALETTASRGLQNSSIGALMGERAAIQSALPIAQQDASTYSSSDLATQQAEQALESQVGNAIIEGELNEQNMDYESTQTELNRLHELAVQENNFNQETLLTEMSQAHESIESELDRLQQSEVLASQQGHEEKMAGISNSYNVAMQEMQNEFDLIYQDNTFDNDQATAFQATATQLMHDYQTDVTTLISDMNFLESSASEINSALNSLKAIAKNNIKMAGSMAGIPTSDLEQYLANI